MGTTEIFGSDLEIHEEGQHAFWMGYDSSVNPYEVGTNEHQTWIEGYNDPRGELE